MLTATWTKARVFASIDVSASSTKCRRRLEKSCKIEGRPILRQAVAEASLHYRLVHNYWIKTIRHLDKSSSSCTERHIAQRNIRLRAFVLREALCHRLGMFICGMFLKTGNTRHPLWKLAWRDSLNHLRRRTSSNQLFENGWSVVDHQEG